MARLTERLNTLRVDGDYLFDSPDEAGKAAAALILWYNVREQDLDDGNLDSLVEVASTGKFMFWDCPTCGADVFEGKNAVEEIDPRWSNFQGASENDRTSYPGHGEHDMRCNHCRMWNVGGSRIPQGE